MKTTETFIRARHQSPVGTLHLILDGEALVALDYEGYEPRMMRLLARRFPSATLQDGPVPKALAKALDAYFAGDTAALDAIPLKLGGTEFQRTVWAALRTIPWGDTQSYGSLAKAIGKPSASRAVGLANGSNPVAIVVPCHRVIGADRKLTGYAGGLERKRFLLRHEGVAVAG
ncbi:Methylated-DNA--protein-cysteine methyltransferase [Alphaproteobacteria bacterium SO-S41]|nr:Methylated-DNA--protein-cysteine methyltransferase [Alphaproteobacteria bacterium SO-S41]